MAEKVKSVFHGGWRGFRKMWAQLWRTMVAGLLVWIPLIITVWVCWFFINKLVLGLERQIQALVEVLNEWGTQYANLRFLKGISYVYGLGLALAVALFFVTGLLTRYFAGREMIALGEKIVQKIPLFNRIYRAVQQIRDVFITRKGTIFQKVCLIEFPKPEMYAVGFVTSSEQSPIQHGIRKELLAVFVPTTPNPTSGYLVYVEPEEVTYINISVEEAMKVIVSGGAYLPLSSVHPAPVQTNLTPESLPTE